jgi:hypothetical protein
MTTAQATASATAPEAEAVHWISARAAGRLLRVSPQTFARLAAAAGVPRWHPAGMRFARYELSAVRALASTPARPRASPPAGA